MANIDNVLILSESYIDIIKDLKEINANVPSIGTNILRNTDSYGLADSSTVSIGKVTSYKINPNMFSDSGRQIIAYDESVLKYSCLEGTAFQTAHSLIEIGESDYIAKGYLTFYFYTRAEEIAKKGRCIKTSLDVDSDSMKDYVRDKIKFMLDSVPSNSILLIDGPLIAGDVYTYFISAIYKLMERDIIPIFFVKNSNSNMVINSDYNLAKEYNSDLHWAYRFLKSSERSNFFRYIDKQNPNNSKVFCYIRLFDKSPQRIEMHYETYIRYSNLVDKIIEMICYLLIVQGDCSNLQIRPIAIAEKYAREYIRMNNIHQLLKNIDLVETMNQERFGW